MWARNLKLGLFDSPLIFPCQFLITKVLKLASEIQCSSAIPTELADLFAVSSEGHLAFIIQRKH
jgi:hypothetical protein